MHPWGEFYRAASKNGYIIEVYNPEERANVRKSMLRIYEATAIEHQFRGLHIVGKEGEVFGKGFFEDEEISKYVVSELEWLLRRTVKEGESMVFYKKTTPTEREFFPNQYDRVDVWFWRKKG